MNATKREWDVYSGKYYLVTVEAKSSTQACEMVWEKWFYANPMAHDAPLPSLPVSFHAKVAQ
jgi:hypothetical protein